MLNRRWNTYSGQRMSKTSLQEINRNGPGGGWLSLLIGSRMNTFRRQLRRSKKNSVPLPKHSGSRPCMRAGACKSCMLEIMIRSARSATSCILSFYQRTTSNPTGITTRSTSTTRTEPGLISGGSSSGSRSPRVPGDR